MRKLWKQVDRAQDSPIAKDQPATESTQKDKRQGARKTEVDDLTSMMKDLKIYQLESQKKLEEQLMEIRNANARQYPPPQLANVRGCYWDGGHTQGIIAWI